ncbi:mannan endo-1,4-beta-mannosidase 1-like isoform X1 [Phalaenopsis equestris]|uniref:mannan endo-1,4-beta-mannosidase 1-like isoform X1 n=1 Tax=Phalaenopsis equestris TaxID=78828 RepID=UPI0009E285B7|nr:mannan endo-1,4-beta-mannosidase 1-like isoform X1 [Phalaenopsis equestris]XP_020584505.1 mannan endo-1,4-beta-mannosidase 1-like isoform X1 [Phalaenopsis equestris]
MRLTILLGVFLILLSSQNLQAQAADSFISTNGLHFTLNGSLFFSNGFNAYWLMIVASDPSQRDKVSTAFKEASINGLTIARPGAFNDGGSSALQYSPGSYNEHMFKGLDFVISEARRYGIWLILSLVNNYDNFGGKPQYVQWARNQGESIGSDDEFFTNNVVKGYYKNHVKSVLTRNNTLTGVAYKDDPTIFAWELMNEARCPLDTSGKTLQAWIAEMSAHVKSIDSNHLLEVGLEGFYASSSPSKLPKNLTGFQVGTDFISNNQISRIDFATLHSYPDQWIPNSSDHAELQFSNNWLDAHIRDANNILHKPLLIAEFGKSMKDPGYNNSKRDALFQAVYFKVYQSARRGGAAAGCLFWQLLVEGMDSLKDGYEIQMNETPMTTRIIHSQCGRLQHLTKLYAKKSRHCKAREAKGHEKCS